MKLPLGEFGRLCEFSHDLLFQGNKSTFNIKVKLQIREALRVKEEENIPITKLIISQIPPSFKTEIGEEELDMEAAKTSKDSQYPMIEKSSLPSDPALPTILPQLPDKIREIDVKDPDNIGNYIR